jgi:UDP:flavonoid glycosyltransferase YjiC (YdhE family)
MRVLLTSFGSTGDIFPVIRVGKALLDAGHQVRFATSRFFRDDIERAGLDFVPLPPDWDQGGFAEAMRELSRSNHPIELLARIYRESLPFIDVILETLETELKHADVMVASYLFSHLTELAHRHGVPCHVLTFAHNVVPSPEYPPDGVPGLPLPQRFCRCWNRLAWRLADKVICHSINRVIGKDLQRHKLSLVKSFLLEPADRVIVTVSPSLFQPKRLWSERFYFSGYQRWQAPEDEQLLAEVDAFCAGERVPILTFGSVTFDEARQIMHRFLTHWPEGKKMIVQAGWAGLTIERPSSCMLRVGRCSHDALFKRGSMVIHHGGAGTTASVLHAGVPQIIIPHMGDQFFFGAEIERLGVGYRLKRKKWPEQLPSLVRKIESKPKLSQRAKEVASQLAAEDGPATAVRIIEEGVATHSGK